MVPIAPPTPVIVPYMRPISVVLMRVQSAASVRTPSTMEVWHMPKKACISGMLQAPTYFIVSGSSTP